MTVHFPLLKSDPDLNCKTFLTLLLPYLLLPYLTLIFSKQHRRALRSPVRIAIMPRPLRRLEIKLERANTSEIIGMVSIFGEAFLSENPKLAQAMYAGSHPTLGVEDILKTQLDSRYSKFMIAYDTTKGLVPDPGFEREGVDDDMSYGWISLGVVPPDTTLNSYVACELSFPSHFFLTSLAFRVARLVLGVKELPGPVLRLRYDPKRNILTPNPFR